MKLDSLKYYYIRKYFYKIFDLKEYIRLKKQKTILKNIEIFSKNYKVY